MDVDDAISCVTRWLDQIDGEAARTNASEIAREYGTSASTAMSVAPASERTLRRAAMHEASHAVAAISQGVRLRRVVLHADGRGTAELEESDGAAVAISQLAAPMLELLGDVGEWRRCELSCSFDVQAARAALSECPGISHRAAATAAATVVLSRMGAIERVGTALLALGALDGREVAALSGALQ